MWIIFKMRKFHQLVLLVLSVLSLVALLFYRHEYNKLRYVLEVLNFFGTPGGSASSGNCTDSHPIYLQEPLPSWQRVSNSLFIYSAFWDTVENKKQVKALAIGTLNENLNFECFLWFEEFENPVKGQFSFSAIPRLDKQNSKIPKTKGYLFYCDPHGDESAPYGVTFYKTKSNDAAFIPVLDVHDRNTNTTMTGICVLPLESPQMPKTTVLEFLSYHQVVGVNNFIVYGGKYTHALLNTVKEPLYNLDINILQWNYPFANDVDLTRGIVEQDCVLRSKGVFQSVILLYWDQMLVPRFHTEIPKLITDLDVSKNAYKFQLVSYLFCLQFKDDPKSELSQPTPLRKTRYIVPKLNNSVFIYRPNSKYIDNEKHISKVSKEIVVVHWYTQCGPFDLKNIDKKKNIKNDYSFLKFNGDFYRSKILKVPSLS